MADSAPPLPLPPPPGVYVPVPTFFVSHSSEKYIPWAPPPDLDTQAQHAVYLANSGIKGLVILGSTGEAVSLTNTERFEVLSHVCQQLKKAGFENYPIIAGVATQSFSETLMQLHEAKKAGAQWGLCLVPGFFASAVTQQGIIEWFTGIADQSPIPIMIYHYPAVSNNIKLVPRTVEVLSRHPNIVGCKLSHGDVSYHAQIGSSPDIDKAHFHTFTGLGQQLLPILSVGCAGTIDGAAGFFPKSVVHLYELSVKDNASQQEIEERRILQCILSAVEELVVKYGTVGIKEATSRLRGFGDRDGTRLPLYGGIPGGNTEWANWEKVMADLETIEKSLPR